MLYGKLTPLAQVLKTPYVAPPDAGAWYKGIKHKDLYDLVTFTVNAQKFTIEEEAYAVSPNGVEFAGAVRLAPEEPLPKDCPRPWLAWTTANDRRNRLRFYLGGTLAFSPTIYDGHTAFVFKELCKNNHEKTHTINTDLPARIRDAVSECSVAMQHLGPFAATARDTVLDAADYHSLLMAAGRGAPKLRALPWSKFGIFDKMYEASKHSMMAFLACHSRIVRGGNPLTQIPAMLRMRQVIRECGLLKPPARKAS